MENNQCENTHPMLPINDSCVVNIKLLNVEDKELIIQDLKDVIVDYRNKSINSNIELIQLLQSKISNLEESKSKLINDLNICQSANKRQSEIIKELQLENSEVNKLLSTYKFSFYLIASIVTVVSVVGSIITLIK